MAAPFDLLAEVLGGTPAAPVIGAGRPQPAPSAPPTIPPEAIAGFVASWLLRIVDRPAGRSEAEGEA